MQRLKDLRKKKNETQDDVAQLINVSRPTYSNYERGFRKPSYDDLVILAEHFNVSIDYLLERDPSPLIDTSFPAVEVVASISAGYNGVAYADICEQMPIPAPMLHGYAPEECKLFRVKGNSMFPKYENGDYVLVHLQTSVDSGEIAVVIYNGDEATVKEVRYVKGEDWLEMIPRNPEYMPKRIEGADLEKCVVYGKVIGLLRF